MPVSFSLQCYYFEPCERASEVCQCFSLTLISFAPSSCGSGIKPFARHVLDKHSTPEFYSQPHCWKLWNICSVLGGHCWQFDICPSDGHICHISQYQGKHFGAVVSCAQASRRELCCVSQYRVTQLCVLASCPPSGKAVSAHRWEGQVVPLTAVFASPSRFQFRCLWQNTWLTDYNAFFPW